MHGAGIRAFAGRVLGRPACRSLIVGHSGEPFFEQCPQLETKRPADHSPAGRIVKPRGSCTPAGKDSACHVGGLRFFALSLFFNP